MKFQAEPTVPSKFDKPMLLERLECGHEYVQELIKLVDRDQLHYKLISLSGTLPSEVGIEIMNRWENDHPPIFNEVAQKIALDEDGFRRLLRTPRSFARAKICSRKDLTPDQLLKLAETFLINPGMGPVLEAIVDNENCDSRVLEFIWNNSANYQAYIANRKNLPINFQNIIANSEDIEHLQTLLQNPHTNSEVRKFLVYKVRNNQNALLRSFYLSYGEIKSSDITIGAFSDELAISAAASDRLCEVASQIRVREYVKKHTGLNYLKIHSLVTELISRQMPLGWFVCASSVLRCIFPRNPDAFHSALQLIRNSNVAGVFRSLAETSTYEQHVFKAFVLSVPAPHRVRLTLCSIVRGDINPHFFTLVDSVFDQKKNIAVRPREIKQLDCLKTYINAYLDEKRLYEEPKVSFDHVSKSHWEWISRLDGLRIASGHRLQLVKSTSETRRLGMYLSNCLASQYHLGPLIDCSKALIILTKNNSTEYVIEIETSTGDISQFLGKKNNPPSAFVDKSLRNAVDSVIPRES